MIAMTGATGFIGRRLIARLQRDGESIRLLGRSDPRLPGVEFVLWEPARDAPVAALRGVRAVIHLAGEPVAQRWSEEVKRKIRDSRVLGTRHLVDAIAQAETRPEVLIAASAVGYYGDRGEEVLTEMSAPGNDFLAQTCIEWERESQQATGLGVRVPMLRTGMVLGQNGGALKQMVGPFKAGLGGPVGSGKQWVSWIHIEDVVELILFALRNGQLSGPVNATAPNPVRNVEFAKELGSALHRPAVVPAPAFGLKLVFGEMSTMLLASQRVIPEAASRAGFAFRHPEIREALRQILT